MEFYPGSWESIAMLIVGIMILLSVIVYVLGRVANAPRWILWGKEEFVQAIITAALVGALLAITITLTDMSEEIIGGDPFTYSHAYLDEQLSLSQGMRSEIYMMKVLSDFLANSIQLGVGYETVIIVDGVPIPVRVMAEAQPLKGLKIVTTLLSMLFCEVIFVSFMIGLVKAILVLFEGVFYVVLPVGVILRSLVFTRSSGATLISLAIGCYIVFPLLLASSIYFMGGNGINLVTADEQLGLAGQRLDPLDVIRQESDSWADNVWNSVKARGDPNEIGAEFIAPLASIGEFIFSIIILVSLDSFLSYLFMRELANYLAGDIVPLKVWMHI